MIAKTGGTTKNAVGDDYCTCHIGDKAMDISRMVFSPVIREDNKYFEYSIIGIFNFYVTEYLPMICSSVVIRGLGAVLDTFHGVARGRIIFREFGVVTRVSEVVV
jgi:hypothetical protein